MLGLDVQRSGHVAVLTVDWPPKNFLTTERLRALADVLDELDRDRPCRAVVVQAKGRVFSGGVDPAGMRDGGVAGEPVDPEGRNPLYVQAVRLFATRKPIVIAVDGPAVGAGLGLALIADVRVGSTRSWFAAPFVKLGFHPGFGLTHTLPRLIGPHRAADMLLRGARVPAEQAHEYGLLDVVTTPDSLAGEALNRADDLASNAPLAVQRTRATLRADLADRVSSQIDLEGREQNRLVRTADFAEGVRAVVERRPAVFEGR